MHWFTPLLSLQSRVSVGELPTIARLLPLASLCSAIPKGWVYIWFLLYALLYHGGRESVHTRGTNHYILEDSI
jgi:hypothetical protein